MVTTISADDLFFGAPASLTVGGDEVGATLTAPKVSVEATQYAPEFLGAGGPVSGAVFTTKIMASVEFDVNEITAAKLAWSLPGSTSSAGAGTPSGGGDAFATTLAANTVVGDSLLIVAATTDLVEGAWLKIGTGADAEFRKVKAFSTDAIELNEALLIAHTTADDVVRTVDGNTTTISWSTGRVPSSAFKDVVIDGVGLDGQHLIVTVTDALSDGKLSIEMSDSTVAGSHVVMTGYYDGANPTLCPVSIAVG